jgi:hypothetical protein
LIEGSWTTLDHGVPTGPIIYGTEGTMVVDAYSNDENAIRVERGGGQTTYYSSDPLPAGRDNVARELIHHLDTGDALHDTLQVPINLEAMAILDAGVRSANSQRLELVDNGTWRIG